MVLYVSQPKFQFLTKNHVKKSSTHRGQKKSMKKYRMDPWMKKVDPGEEAIIEETVIHDPLQSHQGERCSLFFYWVNIDTRRATIRTRKKIQMTMNHLGLKLGQLGIRLIGSRQWGQDPAWSSIFLPQCGQGISGIRDSILSPANSSRDNPVFTASGRKRNRITAQL